MPQGSTRQYILLPSRGLRAPVMQASALFPPFAAPGVRLRVIDAISEDGARLVELDPEDVRRVRFAHPGLRLVPLAFHRPAVVALPAPVLEVEAAATELYRVTVAVRSLADGRGIAGVRVVAFTDFGAGEGAEGVTDRDGEVGLVLRRGSGRIQRIYAFPTRGFWGCLQRDIEATARIELPLAPLDLAQADVLRRFYRKPGLAAGEGVVVGVVDTGIDGSHGDLVVAGGCNTVVGEGASEHGDNGEAHGTHVAGIIAARGNPPGGLRGVAPGVTLRSYRVFGKGQVEASNYAIIKAVDAAVEDGCDLVNMSLGGGPADAAMQAAIEDARERGTVIIVAAGNDDRSPVSFPASDSLVLAVSAMGRTGTFPASSPEAEYVAPPFGRDRDNFLASFTNVGPEVDLVGPGVAVVSTVPGGHAVLSGTSMACPAVTGVAARLLAAHPEVLALSRDARRSDAIIRLLLEKAKPLGFGSSNEGHGLPLVS